MGALGSILVVVVAGRFNFSVLRETALATTRITAGMMFILICAQVFALAFRGLHGEKLVEDLFNVVPGGVRHRDQMQRVIGRTAGREQANDRVDDGALIDGLRERQIFIT